MKSKLTRRSLLANGALLSLFGGSQASIAATRQTPWLNWSGGQSCLPSGRFSPTDEAELSDYLARTSGKIRPVGSGHSFTPLVPTDGHLIVIDQLQGLLDHSPDSLQATFAAGTTLQEMGPLLAERGQAMLNLPDIDRQTLAGATATATHGTGIGFTCLSGFVTGLRLIKPNGEVVDVDAISQPDLFNAARVSLGALGVVTQMTLQNQAPYRLKAQNWVATIEENLEQFDQRASTHRHFEMFPLVHSDYALTLAIDETDEPINNPPPSAEEAAAFGAAMASWAETPPRDRKPLVNGLAEAIQPTEVVDESYNILSNIRNNRFNEMEYSVPLENGAPCLREILQTIQDREVDVLFPLEYRYVKRDDTWLSMSSGHEDHAAISIHRVAGADYRPYFELMEPIFWKYGGRPHWGKIHSLGAAELTKLYPHFADFQALRAEIDPQGRMLNPHLRKLFVNG